MLDLRQGELYDLSGLGNKPRKYLQNLYFALRPPAPLATAIQRLGTDLSARSGERRKASAANLHLSLNHVAEAPSFDDQVIEGARLIGQAIATPSFDLVLDRLMTFGDRQPYPIVLTCAEGAADVRALSAMIMEEMRTRGQRAARFGDVPHVTLWYSNQVVPTRPLARPFRWRVNDFWLILSHTGQGRHTWPGHWPLKH